MKISLGKLVSRKIVSASVSSFVFIVLISFLHPIDDYYVEVDYLQRVTDTMFLYSAIAAPIILIYGTITSLISEYLVLLLGKYKPFQGTLQQTFSLAFFHLFFGLILLWLSLFPALLFFLTDLWLSRRKKAYTMPNALCSILLPLFLFVSVFTIEHTVYKPKPDIRITGVILL
ncbi:hypothetical protein ACFDTO_34895 [Microbacteriaceae bacterium 4G12]